MQIVPTGEVGLGVTPAAGTKLDVGGAGRFQTANGNVNIGTPSGETGITFTNANRGDIRFDASGLKLLANAGTGIPPVANGLTVNNDGNVGIGTTTTQSKLHIEGNADGAVYANGNVRQSLSSNGVAKAMLYVNSDGTIARCYNGQTNTSVGNCGFTITRNVGSWWIDFGFQVDNRFWSGIPGVGVTNVGLQANPVGQNILAVKLFQTDVPNSTGETVFRHFMLVVY
jgi:hypothetical protein